MNNNDEIHQKDNRDVSRIREQFEDLISQLRENISEIQDERKKALFETSAEVIIGLQKTFTDFEAEN